MAAVNDRPLTEASSAPTILTAVLQARQESEQARRTRLDRNTKNFATYMGVQDWSGKIPGQSREFLPKTGTAVENLVAFIDRGIRQGGDDWYSIDLPPGTQSPLTPEEIRSLINCFINDLPDGDMKHLPFSVVLGDGVKVGALEALMIFKVHGRMHKERRFIPDPDDPNELIQQEFSRWRLHIDIFAPENYYPDPTGRGLYEILEHHRDLHEVIEAAEDGIYDIEVVRKIEEDFRKEEQEARDRRALSGQDEAGTPSYRKQVVIHEYWGTLLDNSGRVVMKNALVAIANDRYIIRAPEENPFWHQESPIVVAPIIRVPFTVWHKALFDDAAPLNTALNEVVNLIIDGGMASVWGIKQLQMDKLEDPRQVSGGLVQGDTLRVKGLAPNEDAVKQINTGSVPPEALQVAALIDNEFNQAAMTSEIRRGSLPPKEVRATEVIEASQSQDLTIDKFVRDIEDLAISQLLRKAALTILQNADNLAADAVVASVGLNGAFKLSRMTPAERFSALAPACNFRVRGLSATLARVRDFQKFMALFQAVQGNPMLFEAFQRRFSPDKSLNTMLKQLNIDPRTLENDKDENPDQRLQRMRELQQITDGTSGDQNIQASEVGSPELPAEVNQETNPLTGLVSSS